MASAVLASKTGEANFQRIARLLIIGSTKLLREFFDIRCPASQLSKILQNPVTAKSLRRANLTKRQWDCLYPTPVVYGKSTDFNISLLLKLLRTVCDITPPVTGWDARPSNADQSLAADLARVKYYHDFVYSQMSQNMMEITDEEVPSICEELSGSLLRIAARISTEKRFEWQKVIDKFLKDPLVVEEGKNVQELLKLYENDTEVIKEILSEMTTSSQDLSLQTALQMQDIKNLLREELKSKSQGVQKVEHLSSEGVRRGLKGTTHRAEEPARDDMNIRDQPGEVYQSTKSLSSSAGGHQPAGGQLTVFVLEN